MFLTNAFGRDQWLLYSLELRYPSWKLAYLHTLSKNPGILNGRRQKTQGPVGRRAWDGVSPRSDCANNMSQKSPSDSLSCLYSSKFLALESFLMSKSVRLLPTFPLNIWSANMPLATCVRKGQGRKQAVDFPKVSSPLQYITEVVRCSHHAI